MKSVYFLGAGSSKNFGYPLTNDIMPEIILALKDNSLFFHSSAKTQNAHADHSQLLEYFYQLYPGLNNVDVVKEKNRIPNITEVLSMVDHCSFYNIPPHPNLSDQNLEQFRQLLNRAIGELMLNYEEKPYTNVERNLLNSFISPIRKSRTANDSLTFITTNYDLIIDNEIQNEFLIDKVDYGITYRNVFDSNIVTTPSNSAVKYYKLHGSLNWLQCSLCGYFYINPYGCIIHQAFKNETDNENTCICSDHLRLKTVLVSPSLVRDIRDSNLLQIWRSALESIRVADKLVFIGYSLPSEDLAIKSIIMRGINGRKSSQKLEIDIVQMGDAAKNNYFNLFGNGINYYGNGLEEYLQTNNIA